MGIRLRLMVWLVVMLTPVIVGGTFALQAIDTRVSDQAEADLSKILDLEVSRVTSALGSLEQTATLLADDPALIALLDPSSPVSPTSDGDVGRDAIESLIARDTRAAVHSAVAANRTGTVIAASNETTWWPGEALVLRAMDLRRPLFAPAYEAVPGDARLGIVVPVVTADGSVIGALLVEFRLALVTDLVYRYERFAETSEIALVQRTADGEVELITQRRFARNSAFGRAMVTEGSPSALSLTSDDVQVINSVDYRGVETISAVRSIEATGWGIVAKMDVDEAFALRAQVARYLIIAGLAVFTAVVAGWMAFIRPLGGRLRSAAEAADRVTAGDYEMRLADDGSDEVGQLARSIDGLAADLAHDIEVRQATQERLVWRTEHDILTGLVNRRYAVGLIEEYTEASRRYGALFLDLDGFKEINDTHGHHIGDEVLRIVASRLQVAAGDDATVARWGGDEFLIVVTDRRVEDLHQVADSFEQTLSKAIATTAGAHFVGASIGIATSDEDGSAGDVLQLADAAMFQVKHTRNSYRKISPSAIRMVESALAEQRIEVALQPVVWVSDGRVGIRGAEALVRLRHTDGSVAMPGEFLDGLGTNALAVAVDMRVLSLSLESVGRWRDAGLVDESFRLAVNLGPGSMNKLDIAEEVAETLRTHRVPPELLQIEIPETVERPSPELLDAFKDLHIELAIDDVGCQYSNLERLVDVAANVAKIDRRWIPTGDDDRQQDIQLLAGLVDQCHMLGFTVIAEGIETTSQLKLLQGMGVQVFQGYLFGRPQPASDLEVFWLEPNRDRSVADFG